MNKGKFLIITGISGAGKSQVLRALEDVGFFCVDNLPPALIPKFAELCNRTEGKVDHVALVVDIRGGAFFGDLLNVLTQLKEAGIAYELLFLEARPDTLIRRYKETRRRHPLAKGERLSEGIRQEIASLAGIRSRANTIIDTSDIKSDELKNKILSIYSTEQATNNMSINILSFGFKYGLPLDADMVFDVRFLPNPFYVDHLKRKSGNNAEVAEYISKWQITKEFLEKLYDMINFLMPNFVKEGKNQVVIAIGCTGGLHRSVFISNKIYSALKLNGYQVNCEHRDITKNNVEE